MDIIFMNSKNSKTSVCDILILNLSEKTNLNTNAEYIALSNFSTY